MVLSGILLHERLVMIVVVGGKERRKYDVEEDVGKGKEEEENDV